MLIKGTKVKRIFCMLLICILSMQLFAPAVQAATMLTSAPLSRGTTQNGMVRVRLSSLGNPSSLKLTVNGSYTVNGKSSKSIASGSVLQVGFNASTGKLTLTHNGTTTDMGETFKLRRHATDGSNGIKIVQGRVPSNLYPGDFEFISRKSSSGYTLYVIVHVYIEDYLYGVLPYEMGNSSGLEALKAQAVAARTYTLRAMDGPSTSIYDVVDTASDQVYSGTPSGNANCKAAVDATKGIVGKTGSAYTAMYYSASNGGQTESIKNIWGSNTYTYLKVKDDPYDLANPASKKKSFTVNANGTQSNATLQSILNNKAASRFGTGAQVTAVTDIRLHTPKYASPSKLYTKADFTVRYSRNGSVNTGTLTFDIFNELESPLGMSINSGSNELWSVDETANGYTVYARRYGHGLGMSQRGAMYMAQIGYTYDQILAFYFEGCTRVQYTFTRSILSPVISGQESSEETIIEKPADLEGESEYTAIVTDNSGTALMDTAYGTANTMVTLPKGAKVTVNAADGNYYLVTYGSLTGYVAKAALEHNGAADGAASVPTRLYGYGMVVNSNALNLRTAPSMTGSNVLTTVPGKTVLPIFSMSGQWAYVQYGLRVGYVSMDYIQLVNAQQSMLPSSPTQAPGSQQVLRARVTTANGSLNLRKKASSDAAVLTTIPQYTVIDVLANLGSWCEVVYNGSHGFVMSKFLTFVTDESAAPSTPVPTPTPLPTQAPSASLQYARVTTKKGSLNLRETASSNARVLRTIPQYEVIEVHQNLGSWCKVEYAGTTGYVMRSFLTFVQQPSEPTQKLTATPAPTAAPVATPSPQVPGKTYARVTTKQGSLNLRNEPNGRVLCTIPQYETIEVLSKGSQWSKVVYNGNEGYVMTSFLTFIQNTPVQTPTATPAAVSTPAPTATPVVTQPTQAPTQQTNIAYVNTAQGSLNLREKANGKVLCTIPQYEMVIVLSKGSSWTKVYYQGTTGYVMTKFLSFSNVNVPEDATPKPAATATPSVPPQNNQGSDNVIGYAYVRTISGSLNIRERADADAKVISTIPQDEKVAVYQKGTVWSRIGYQDSIGYVMSSFLSFTDNSTNNNSQPIQQPGTSGGYMDPTLKEMDEVLLGRVMSGGTFLNLRAYCSLDAKVLAEMPQYMYVVITKAGNEWCEVIYEDKTGYCLTKYLEFDLP